MKKLLIQIEIPIEKEKRRFQVLSRNELEKIKAHPGELYPIFKVPKGAQEKSFIAGQIIQKIEDALHCDATFKVL